MDFFCVTEQAHFQRRYNKLALELGMNFVSFESELQFFGTHPEVFSQGGILIYHLQKQRINQLFEQITSIKAISQNCSLLIVLNWHCEPGNRDAFRLMGVENVFFAQDILDTSILEYVLYQHLKINLFPINSSDVKINSICPCNVFHYLSNNRHFFPVIAKGELMTEEKQILTTRKERLFILETDMVNFERYLETTANEERINHHLARFIVLNITNKFFELCMLLVNQSTQFTATEATDFFDECQALASNLITIIEKTKNPFESVLLFDQDNFGCFDRMVGMSVLAGLLSAKYNIGKPREVFIAALLSDVGLLRLNPEISRKIRLQSALEEAELNEYHQHPIFSIEYLSHKNIPVSPKIKDIILETHELPHKKGFPIGISKHQIPLESQLIQLSERLYDKAKNTLLVKSLKLEVVLKDLLTNDDEHRPKSLYSDEFLAAFSSLPNYQRVS